MSDEPPLPDAPASIAVVRDFVNTLDHETGIDEITTQAELARYLVRGGLLDGASARASAADLALALRLRAGLRRALEANSDHDHHAARETLPELAGALRELPIALDWGAPGPTLRTTARGVRSALARIGLAVHSATSEGDWWRLKVCSDDECRWAYYDHSKNRSRSWCGDGCGNKAKTRAYRARQRARAR